MKYDYRPSRLEGGKVLKNKRKVLGPQVVLDQERCILCTRCVRFMNEVPKEPQLGLFGRDFRFRARAWFLSATPSVCTGCSRGCNIYADWMSQDTYRYRPRENEQINKSWMCDQGRLSYKYLNLGRVLSASVGRHATQSA